MVVDFYSLDKLVRDSDTSYNPQRGNLNHMEESNIIAFVALFKWMASLV